MLARAADWLKPGGTLVYAVCSLEPEEGEQVADAFLSARGDYRLEPSRAGASCRAPTKPDGGRQLLHRPAFEAEGGADGFFVARFRDCRG